MRREVALAAGYEADEKMVGDDVETAKVHPKAYQPTGGGTLVTSTSWDEAEDAVLSRCRRQIVELYSIWIRI